MRLGILLKDTEYRDALIEKLLSYDKDIFVNIISGPADSSPDSLIVTDAGPGDIDSKLLDAIKARTVFLTVNQEDSFSGCHTVFKYARVANIVSELSLAYNEWHGDAPGRKYPAKLIYVLCETDAFSADRCGALARQIIYRCGGNVLIVPLSYVNDHAAGETDGNMLSRLLYSIRTGRERASDCYTYTDGYGVSSLLLQPGINPVAFLDEDELRSLITGLAARFDSIILDAGTCLRSENTSLMKDSDHIIWFGTGRRSSFMDEATRGIQAEKIIRIRHTGEADEAIALDDCIKSMFSIDKDDDHKN